MGTNSTPSSAATICASEVLPRPGGPASSTWSSASPRARAASMNTASCSFTRSWPTKSSSVRGRSERSSSSSAGSATGSWTRSTPGVRMPLIARPSAPRRSGPRASRRRRASSSPSASCGSKPRPSRPSRASVRGSSEAVWRTTISSRHLARHLLAQLDDDALGGALADAGHGLEAGGVAGGDRVQQLARRAAREHRQRHLRPDPLHPDQHQEQLALGLGGEAEQVHAVVAQHEVGEQARLARPPPGRRRASRRTRPGGSPRRPPRSPPRRPPRDHLAAHGRDHAGPLTPAPPSAARRWRGRWPRRGRRRRGRARGGSGSESSVPTIRCTWSFSAPAAAAHRLLDRLRRVREAGHAGHAGRQQHHAARLADREGGAALRPK